MVKRKVRQTNSAWWGRGDSNRVWVEITRREKIGVDINHDSTSAIKLLKLAKKGERVIHWDSKSGCFVGTSIINDHKPYRAAGCATRKLTGFTPFPKDVVSLQKIQKQWKLIHKIYEDNIVAGQPLHFPFVKQINWKRLIPAYAYLAVAPPELIIVLGEIYEKNCKKGLPKWNSYGFQKVKSPKRDREPYDAANETIQFDGATYTTTRELLAKATAKHNKVLNSLAQWLTKNGYEPDRTPSVDLNWSTTNTHFICEVKTLGDSEISQLRLGLGQVLSYRYEATQAEAKKKQPLAVKAILAVDRKPKTDMWEKLCSELGVLLIWPKTFTRIRSISRH